jgi:hypothetical protein
MNGRLFKRFNQALKVCACWISRLLPLWRSPPPQERDCPQLREQSAGLFKKYSNFLADIEWTPRQALQSSPEGLLVGDLACYHCTCTVEAPTSNGTALNFKSKTVLAMTVQQLEQRLAERVPRVLVLEILEATATVPIPILLLEGFSLDYHNYQRRGKAAWKYAYIPPADENQTVEVPVVLSPKLERWSGARL